MIFKLFITCVIIFVGEDTYTKLCVAIIFAVCTWVATSYLKPHLDRTDFHLAFISYLCLSMCLILGVILKGLSTEAEWEELRNGNVPNGFVKALVYQ